MSCYQFDITYVKEELNKVADCLSRYFESDQHGEHHAVHEYVDADVCIDPESNDFPYHCYKEVKEHVVELQAMQTEEHQQSCRLQESRKVHDVEAEALDMPQLASGGNTSLKFGHTSHIPKGIVHNNITLAEALETLGDEHAQVLPLTDEF